MKRIEAFLERLYETKISRQYDRIVPVVGDEGVGKSTLMVQCTWLWQDILGNDPGVKSVLDAIVWGEQEEFEAAMANREPRSVIPVMDAARVLHKRKAMHPDQIETESDLLDVRMKEFLILLGFQDWDTIPSMLQERRAKNLLYIPQRGHVWGYSRSTLDERVGADKWPEPDMKATFPSLEGTPLWEEFKQRDREQKEKRINADPGEEEEESEVGPKDLASEIKASGEVIEYVARNEFNGATYIDADLIELDYGISSRKAKLVKKVLSRDDDVDVEALWQRKAGTPGEGGKRTVEHS